MDTLFIKLKVNHIFQQTVALVTFKSLGKIHFYIDPYTQTEDLLFNPRNPENPDSKLGESGWIFHWNLSGKRGEASRLYEYGNSENTDSKLFTENITPNYLTPQKYIGYPRGALPKYYAHRCRWKLCAQQLIVWIRIYRISRINDNVVDLSRKIIIRWCLHFEASSRCVTHRRKRRYKVPNIRMNLTPKSKTSFVILEILIQNQVKADEYYIGTYRGKDDA